VLHTVMQILLAVLLCFLVGIQVVVVRHGGTIPATDYVIDAFFSLALASSTVVRIARWRARRRHERVRRELQHAALYFSHQYENHN